MLSRTIHSLFVSLFIVIVFTCSAFSVPFDTGMIIVYPKNWTMT